MKCFWCPEKVAVGHVVDIVEADPGQVPASGEEVMVYARPGTYFGKVDCCTNGRPGHYKFSITLTGRVA